MRIYKINFAQFLLFNSRERGLAEVVDLLFESMEVEIDQLKKKNSQLEEEKSQMVEEKESQLSQSLLEKIPNCPVNSHLRSQRQTNQNAFFLRSVLSSSRRTGPSTAVWPDITSVDPARLRRPSRYETD